MQEDTELIEFVQKGVEAGDDACDVILEKVRDVLESRNAPMVNRFMTRLKLSVDRLYRTYFGSTPEAELQLMIDHVKGCYPGLRK